MFPEKFSGDGAESDPIPIDRISSMLQGDDDIAATTGAMCSMWNRQAGAYRVSAPNQNYSEGILQNKRNNAPCRIRGTPAICWIGVQY
jgi:hypothetical protein